MDDDNACKIAQEGAHPDNMPVAWTDTRGWTHEQFSNVIAQQQQARNGSLVTGWRALACVLC